MERYGSHYRSTHRLGWSETVSSVSLVGTDFKFVIEQPDGSYEGKVSPDLKSITGTWKQGQSQQLEFVRPTKDTVWRDDPHHTAQLISVDKERQAGSARLGRFRALARSVNRSGQLPAHL